MSKHPIQPLYTDNSGTIRFKENKIVTFLLDAGPFDLNQLALMNFTQEDREQFAQLIGYSLSGFGELSYVSSDTYDTAEMMKEEDISELEARANSLQGKLNQVRETLSEIVPLLFKIHSDDLAP